jgi:hypothetical protein
LVSASHGLPSEHLAQIQPFSTHTQLKPYSPKYLAGQVAEEAQIGPKGAWQRAEEQLRRAEYRKAVEDVRRDPNDDIDLQVSYEFAHRQGKPVLLPVFVAAYRYRGKVYRVLVNGETGRVSGEAPYSPFKVGAALLVLIPILILTTIASAGTNWFFYAVCFLLYSGFCKARDWDREKRAVSRASSVYIKKAPSVAVPGGPKGDLPKSAAPGFVPRWKRRR